MPLLPYVDYNKYNAVVISLHAVPTLLYEVLTLLHMVVVALYGVLSVLCMVVILLYAVLILLYAVLTPLYAVLFSLCGAFSFCDAFFIKWCFCHYVVLLSLCGAFGFPSRVRSDKGLENVLIADYMIEKRGAGRCSMITGN